MTTSNQLEPETTEEIQVTWSATRIHATLHFNGSGYIGQPYWPELNTIINISKDVHPKLGEAKKLSALTEACKKRGLTLDDYHDLKELAARPFYTIDGTRAGEIVIPERVLQSFINHASMVAPKAVPRISSKGLTFIGVKVADGMFRTGKTEADAARFERFVVLEESNQRSFSSSLFISDFMATGDFLVDPEIIEPKNLRTLFEYAGKFVGIGGARPQGYGRFKVVGWDVQV